MYKFEFRKSLFQYEKEFAHRELVSFIGLPEDVLVIENQVITVDWNDYLDVDKLMELTYFKQIVLPDGEVLVPLINGWEKSAFANGSTRQATRYFSHGIHEYKGKFNPQVVHSLLRQWNVNNDDLVYDPFAGSGTTLLESGLYGVKSLGTDVNPLAVFISNTKQQSINLNEDKLVELWDQTNKNLKEDFQISEDTDDERLEYLKKWFPMDTLLVIEQVRIALANVKSVEADTILVIISNILREYSFQDPGDLRIRRRKEIPTQNPLLEQINSDIQKYVGRIQRFSEVYQGSFVEGTEIWSDNKTYSAEGAKADFAITSPPYANALPYIDTQRLSIVWLDLAKPKDIKHLDSNLIGSREAPKKELDALRGELLNNTNELPVELSNFLNKLNDSLSDTDGFRRQATPPLLYKYFSEMKAMFKNVASNLKDGAPFLLLVGRNKTTLGGIEYVIDTPYWLSVIASDLGWQLEESIELQTYARYGLHARNSVNVEDLIVLRNMI